MCAASETLRSPELPQAPRFSAFLLALLLMFILVREVLRYTLIVHEWCALAI